MEPYLGRRSTTWSSTGAGPHQCTQQEILDLAEIYHEIRTHYVRCVRRGSHHSKRHLRARRITSHAKPSAAGGNVRIHILQERRGVDVARTTDRHVTCVSPGDIASRADFETRGTHKPFWSVAVRVCPTTPLKRKARKVKSVIRTIIVLEPAISCEIEDDPRSSRSRNYRQKYR